MSLVDPRLVPDELQQLVASLADVDSLAGRVSASRPTREGSRRAAVLIMIAEDSLEVTYTERASTMRTHAGQISFPGGALDPGENAVEAALREAQEEIGLDPSQVTVLGQLPPAHVAASGFDVAAVVALWDGAHGDEGTGIRAVDAAEVAEIHHFPIATLADPAHRVTWRIPGGRKGPAFVVDDVFVWGFTAHLTDCLLDLGGFTRPWDRTRVLDVPQRYFRR